MLATRQVDPATLRPLASVPDQFILAPLWTWSPGLAKAVLHERRRRFGIEEERISLDDLTDDDVEVIFD